MRFLNLCLISVSFFIVGCVFEAKYDFHDPSSIDRMLSNKSMVEKSDFFEKVNIIAWNAKSYPPEAELQGMTYDEIISKANSVLESVNSYNADFLKRMAVKALVSPGGKVSYIKKRGRYLEPEAGFLAKQMGYKEILAELAQIEGGVLSEETINLIEDSSKQIKDKLSKELVETYPEQPSGMDDGRYTDLIYVLREVFVNPDDYERSCVNYYVSQATENGGYSAEEAKSIGNDLCKNQVESIKACFGKGKLEIIDCLSDAVPEPD